MKYVYFKKVEIKNFLSVGEDPVTIEFNSGLNIITGNNKDKLDRRNGVGKSTVADSVYFAIFGSTLRELKKEHIVNNITQRNCSIELYFTINTDGVVNEYRISRKLSPTKCYLYKDGEDITRDTIQNTTLYIQELLNTTPEVFQNCVIMTINNTVPFMAKKKLEKRKFIEGIFNLQVFSNMLADVRTEYNSVSKDLDIECARYEEISNTLTNQQKQQVDADQDHIRNKQKLDLRKSNCERDIQAIEQKIKSVVEVDTEKITEKVDKIDEVVPQVEVKIQKLISNESKLSTMIDMNREKQSKISAEHSTCPTCLRGLDDEHKHVIKEEKQKIENQITDLQSERAKLDGKLKEAKELKSTLQSRRREQTNKLQQAQIEKHKNKTLIEQRDNLKSQLRDIDDDIKSVDKNKVSYDKMIAETTDRLGNTQKDVDKIKSELAKLEIIKFIVSEEGVKSYIVKKILQLFNSKLAYYLKKMDSNCICVFNEYFEDEIIDEKGKPCSYFNFSGAERKNIDLACLFAFMDIRRLQGDVAFNFSMYDELFDSSLDERGVELVIDILKERIESYNECIMVISHRKESTKLATGEVIFLEKQNGVTTRVETPDSELK
jgi:DNA repair exonuclease SbcCD ATPase subunit